MNYGWVNGKRKRKYLYGNSRAEVVKLLKEALRDQEEGAPDPGRLTVEQYLAKWLDHVKTSVELRTYVGYEQHVRLHITPALGQIRLAKLTPMDIQSLYWEKLKSGLSARTVHHTHRVLFTAMRQAVRWQLLSRNPVEAVDPPRPVDREMQYLTMEQCRAFVAACAGERLGVMHMTALLTGLRQGELAGLRWQDVDLDGGSLTVQQTLWWHKPPGGEKEEPLFKPWPKSRKARRVALAPSLVPVLRQHKARQTAERLAAKEWQDYGLVFTRDDGRPLRTTTIRDSLNRVLKSAGLPMIRYHDLRHSTASLHIALGESLKVISELLGHSTIRLTADRYGHLMPDAQQEAARKLDAALFAGKTKRSSD